MGLHPEDAPRTTTADVQRHLAPRPAYPSQKLAPRSAYRYRPMDALETMIENGDAIEMPDGVLLRQGNDHIYMHNGPPPVPLRSRRGATTTAQQYALPAPKQPQQRETEPQPLLKARGPRGRFHWLFWVGLQHSSSCLAAPSFWEPLAPGGPITPTTPPMAIPGHSRSTPWSGMEATQQPTRRTS